MVEVYWRHMQVQYSSDQRSVCSQPGIGISSQNLVPTRVKAWVWAIASATFTPSTSTCKANGCVWRTIQTSPAHLDILRVSEVAGVEDGFIVGVAAAEEDAAAGLGAQQHGDDGPGVAVGEGAVHLPQRVADPVRLGTGDMMQVWCSVCSGAVTASSCHHVGHRALGHDGHISLVIVSVHDQVSKCRKITGNLSLTFRICLPPSEPGLPDTKWNSMSG